MRRTSIIALLLLFVAPGVALGAGKSDRINDPASIDEVRSYLAPLTADMKSAEAVARGLENLAANGSSGKRGVYESAYLAEQAVSIAHARAQQLQQANALTSEERAIVKEAVEQLTDATASVARLRTHIQATPDTFRRKSAQGVRLEAANLRVQLVAARDAIRDVADTYGVSTRFTAVSADD